LALAAVEGGYMASDERAEQRKRAELAKEISGKLWGSAPGKGEERTSEGEAKRVWGFQTSDYEL
jgi:hypothetical protein